MVSLHGVNMGAFIDLANSRFFRLKVISRASSKGSGAAWLCSCDCGNKITVSSGHLRSGHTKSCGCYRVDLGAEKTLTHGMRQSAEYKSWSEMINRCTNPNYKKWMRYGGRGIKVCDEWNDFKKFYADMGDKPKGRFSIDRIDNNGNYEPGNCRWATDKEQARNKSTNRMITYNDETRCLSEWAEVLGIKRETIKSRLSRGATIGQAFQK